MFEGMTHTAYLTKTVEQRMLSLTEVGGDSAAAAANYHLSAGGNRFRCKLALDAGQRLNLDFESNTAIAACCELLHNASLIHDDIQDRDRVRRGRESVWARFGTDVAICTGDLMVSAAYCALAEIRQPDVGYLIAASHRAVGNAISGQTKDRANSIVCTLSLDDYLETVSDKSGSLLCLPLELALTLGGRQDALKLASDAANAFACAYQICDDLDDWREDLAHKRLNIVGVLQANNVEPMRSSLEHATELALQSYRRAHELAAQLPLGSGDLISDYALKQRLALT